MNFRSIFAIWLALFMLVVIDYGSLHPPEEPFCNIKTVRLHTFLYKDTFWQLSADFLK